MNIKSIVEVMLLKERRDVLRLHLYSKLLSVGAIPYERDLDVLVALYEFGGFSDEKEQQEFFELCLTKDLKKSVQSIRNTLAKYTKMGILLKPKNKARFINDKWLPKLGDGKIVLDYKISHY
jgi:hypothetical protein